MRFCFVILHYMTAFDTIECIESIKKLKVVCPIVVVDNASNNGSIETIEERYSEDKNIYIIKNKSNLGFASGNNVGYKYARETLNADFIVVSNNDIIVETSDMPKYIMEYYNENPFHLMGPDIISLVDNGHQNPMNPGVPERKRILKEIFRYRCMLLLSKMGLYNLLKTNDHHKNNKPIFYKQSITGKQLHGSFIIFSPDYIKNEEFAFRPGTFLYMEEAILFQYCRKKGYTMVYTPDIKVYHKEDSSTNSLFNAPKQKREFVFTNMIRSLKIYYNILNKMR